MAEFVIADDEWVERILDSTFDHWREDLSRSAYARFAEGQRRTAWGREHLRRFALVDGAELLCSAKRYDLAAVVDGRAVPVVGIGAVYTPAAHRGRGYARELIERMLAAAAGEGVPLALLFSEIGADYYAWLGFEPLPVQEVTLRVAWKPGAPATLVRGGDDRDLPAIADMGRVRSAAYRWHLDRSVDLIQYAISKKRLLAGLGPPHLRELQFFVAEEGNTAAAYVVVSVYGGGWMIEECGDRDPSGARVGAMLQVLLAREPAERLPVIRAWLPPGFVPPQVTIASSSTPTEVMMVRPLGTAVQTRFGPDDILYWHGDLF